MHPLSNIPATATQCSADSLNTEQRDLESLSAANLAIALALAAQGKPVFPCKQNKRPYTPNGFKDASTSTPQIEMWWRCFPDALPGLPTGGASGVFVVDIDVASGKPGLESLAALEREFGALPAGFKVRTPSGGLHFHYAMPANRDVRNSVSRIAEAIDVRGTDGYVIAPGAMLSDGRCYAVLSAEPPPEAPTWLLEKMLKPPAVLPVSGANESVGAGKRNSTLTSFAGSLRRKGIDVQQIDRMLQIFNTEFCRPPLDPDEVSVIAKSVGRYEYPYSLSHVGNSERFAATYKAELRRSTSGVWRVYNGKVWVRDDAQVVNEWAKDVARCLEAEAIELPDPSPSDPQDDAKQKIAMKKLRLSWAKQSMNNPTKMAVLAESDPAVVTPEDAFDALPYVFNVQNGTLNLKDGQLAPHDRWQLLTKISPAKFDASAACPRWRAFLETIFRGNGELIAFVQRLYGMALSGDTREQVMAVLNGTGKNGKSVFARTIQHVMGDYTKIAQAETLMLKTNRQGSSPEKMGLKGARAIFANESGEDRKLDAAFIKEITGGDPVTSRGHYENETTFRITALISLVTNHKPKINGADFALMRRLLIIPFEVTIPEQDRDEQLPEKLRAEADGILGWLVEGCLLWQAGGLGVPEVVRQQTDEYGQESDPIGQFLDACTRPDPEAKVKSSALYARYRAHCHQIGEPPVSHNSFSRTAAQRYPKRRELDGAYFHGVKLAPFPSV
jgi:putative DNA primase/helicase